MTINQTPWVQTQVLDFMRETTRRAIERGGWGADQPELWLVATQPTGLGFPTVAVTQMPVPDELWASAPPGVVVPALARSINEHGSLLTLKARRELHGVVILSETWDMVTPQGASIAEVERMYERAHRQGMEGHPWAVDAMTMMARDVDGWDTFVSRRRDGTIMEWINSPSDDQAEGRIAAGLAELLHALR
jgi:hypothetical protein